MSAETGWICAEFLIVSDFEVGHARNQADSSVDDRRWPGAPRANGEAAAVTQPGWGEAAQAVQAARLGRRPMRTGFGHRPTLHE